MAEFKEGYGIILSQEDKEIFEECEEPKKYVVFAWSGLAKDWAEYSDHIFGHLKLYRDYK